MRVGDPAPVWPWAEGRQASIREFQGLGYQDAVLIGTVQEQGDALEPITLQV